MKNWPNDFINKIICGDCLDVMKEMPDGCINMCLTSPPYWGLRDYGVEQIFGGDRNCEHDFKLEKTKTTESHHGKSSNETFSGKDYESWGDRGRNVKSSGHCLKCNAWKGQLGLEPTPELYIEHMTAIFHEVKRVLKKEGTLWLNIGDTYGGSCQGGGDTGLSKERYRKELLTYTDKPQKKMMPKCLMMIPERLAWSLIQDGWILRNKIVWYKPNGMPSSVKDRFTNKWEYVFLFSKNKKYYFDLDAAREPHLNIPKIRDKSSESYAKAYKDLGNSISSGFRSEGHDLGKNPGDIWKIPTIPCPIKGIHFATFPEKLCRKAIIPGCPEGGIALDPFSGIGTVCYVAQHLRRKFIGMDIKQEYCEKADKKRLAQGML